MTEDQLPIINPVSDEEEAHNRKLFCSLLRSGKFAQDLGTIRVTKSNDGRPKTCALGVWLHTIGSDHYGDADRTLGFPSTMITNRNDLGVTFHEIADHIEAMFQTEPPTNNPSLATS